MELRRGGSRSLVYRGNLCKLGLNVCNDLPDHCNPAADVCNDACDVVNDPVAHCYGLVVDNYRCSDQI